jgi:hypothetical protein
MCKKWMKNFIVQRHCPEDHSAIFMFAHPAFHKSKLHSGERQVFQIPANIDINPIIAKR